MNEFHRQGLLPGDLGVPRFRKAEVVIEIQRTEAKDEQVGGAEQSTIQMNIQDELAHRPIETAATLASPPTPGNAIQEVGREANGGARGR
jgi:hypothetical protein